MYRRLLILAFVTVPAFLLAASFLADAFQPRTYYGAVLEPVDGVMHCAGQDPGAFGNYDLQMDADEKPIGYMYYIGLFSIGTDWVGQLKRDLRPFRDNMIVLQVGLELTAGGTPFTDDIAAGLLDDDISDFLNGLAEIGLPAYVRIGYEFNGVAWNGYLPDSYKAAFRHITAKVRERDLEIATVWNYAPDGVKDFMDYYPGDEFVDWWAINYFSTWHFTDLASEAYLDSADVHQRPVLIGEATPRYVGTLGGQSSWDQWFAPYFNILHTRPGLKMSCYINWDWAQFPQWSDWGDARLEANAAVRERYAAEMDSAMYVHAGSEAQFRSLLGYDDAQPPAPVQGLVVEDDTWPASISWDPVSDASGIARYLLYDDGVLLDYTANTFYRFDDAQSNDTLQISVLSVDRAGNSGPISAAIAVVIPVEPAGEDERIVNGDFDAGLDSWELVVDDPGAFANVDVDDSGVLNGQNAAHITMSGATGTADQVTFRQRLDVRAGWSYLIRFQARSDLTAPVVAKLVQAQAPFDEFWSGEVTLTPTAQTFADTIFVDRDDTVYLAFALGGAGTRQVWIDNVSVAERLLPLGPGQKIVNGDFELGSDGWELILFTSAASATFDIDATGLLGGQNAAYVDVTESTGTNWHVQLRQPLAVSADKQYIISYRARADRRTVAETWLQQDHQPFIGYGSSQISLTSVTQSYRDTAIVDQDDTVFLTFMVGGSGQAGIWIDDVSVVEEDYDPSTAVKKTLKNGDFESSSEPDPWSLFLNGGASATLEIDDAGPSQNAAHVVVSNTTNTNWHVQLRQPIDVTAGKYYHLQYEAWADPGTRIETWLQKDRAPFTGYIEEAVSLTTEAQTFYHVGLAPENAVAYVAFMVGSAGLGHIWIDNVTVVESDVAVDVERDVAADIPDRFALLDPYPNPFNPSTTISYRLPSSARAVVAVYDLTGRRVETLVDAVQAAGSYSVSWTAAGTASGVYLLQLSSGDGSVSTQKVVLLK